MSFTNGGNGNDAQRGRSGSPDPRTQSSPTPSAPPPAIPLASIPLTGVDAHGTATFGSLVRDATEQMSTLVRAEVALAKAEVTSEVKKGLTGSVFFILALTVLLFSSFFFFFFLAELLDSWMWRWAAFLTVFGAMIVTTVVLAFLGYLRVRKLRAPAKTIDSLKQAKTVLPSGFGSSAQHDQLTPADRLS